MTTVRAQKSGLKRAPAKKRPRKAAAGSRGLAPQDSRLDVSDGSVLATRQRIEQEGGVVLAAYNDPLGKHPLLVAVLPLDKVEPTPFQRDVPDMHHKRLGARAITALIVPQRELAWQILALNTEKAHNLREKSLEVIRIFRNLLEEDPKRPEASFSFYLDEASLVTLGLCYEKNPRFSGGAYNPIVRRLERFSDEALGKAIRIHEKHAQQLMDLDARVGEVVAKLKARGFVSPYLKPFVVARVNPLRWIQGEPPPLEEVLETMRERAAKFNVEKIRKEDLATAGGAPDEPE